MSKLLVLVLLTSCTDDHEPCGSAVRVTGDDAPIGHYEGGALVLDPHFLAGLPSDSITVQSTPLVDTLHLLVPTEDGTWRIGLVPDDDAGDACDWRYRTEVWTTDTLIGRAHTWHLLKHSSPCGVTKQIASWRVAAD